MLRRKIAMAMALAVTASLMLAGSALAKDRNHDRIPDRWEKRHDLSLKIKQARRDQDKDGLRNRGEWRAKLDPRDADTDNDGVEDGEENAGTVESYVGGVLTIKLAGGGTLSAAVTDETEIECDADGGDDRCDDPEGDGHHGESHEEEDAEHQEGGGGEHGDHEAEEEEAEEPETGGGEGESGGGGARAAHGDGGEEDCGPEALAVGAKVLEAELKIRSGEAIWTEVELLTP